jgi:fumarate hydratase class I
MLNLRSGIVELCRKVATSLPPDLERALKEASERAPEGSRTREAVGAYLDRVREAREGRHPLCVESGVPVFFVRVPTGLSQADIRRSIVEAVRLAAEKVPLGTNAVDIVTSENTGTGTGRGFPEIHMEEATDGVLSVELMLKCPSPEREGRLFSLPDSALGAERSLEGVAKCVVETVRSAGGRGCPPYVIGVGAGATRDRAARLAKDQLRRRIGEQSPIAEVAALEDRILGLVNAPEVAGAASPLALGVLIGVEDRHPDALFVDVNLACWAHRRGKLVW